MSIFGSIATYIEFRTENAGLDCLGFYNKGGAFLPIALLFLVCSTYCNCLVLNIKVNISCFFQIT